MSTFANHRNHRTLFYILLQYKSKKTVLVLLDYIKKIDCVNIKQHSLKKKNLPAVSIWFIFPIYLIQHLWHSWNPNKKDKNIKKIKPKKPSLNDQSEYKLLIYIQHIIKIYFYSLNDLTMPLKFFEKMAYFSDIYSMFVCLSVLGA